MAGRADGSLTAHSNTLLPFLYLTICCKLETVCVGQNSVPDMPQYGSVRDPVNLAGSVGSNLLRGDLHIVHPQDLQGHLHEWSIIDVRSAEHFAQGHLPLARNIPIDSLRSRLAEIGKDRPVLVYSRVGYHGYLAYRNLVQSGYRAANLDGGLKLFTDGGYQPQLTVD